MPKRIEIDIIPNNLRHEETIVQIANTLDNLSSAVSYVFNCIDKRIAENTSRLSTIRGRATKLEGRLQYLQTNLNLTAVKMYSAAKYPASHTYRDYQLTIPPLSKSTQKIPSIYKSNVPIKDTPDAYASSNCKTEDGQYAASSHLQEKLQFYHVKSKSSKSVVLNEDNKDLFPPQLSSVSALLLFNSMDSSYEKTMIRFNHHPNEKQEIEDAPDSIVQPWHSTEMDITSNYLYTPTLGEVPQIDVPLSLPDLPGIVLDEKFVLDLNCQSPIAPSSAVTTPTVHVDLPAPNVLSERRSKETVLTLPNLIDGQEFEATTIVTPPPPPPLPPPSTILPPAPSIVIDRNSEQINQQVHVLQIAPSVSPPAPPPPPPPPPSISPSGNLEDSAKTDIKKTSGTNAALHTDDRSNLMAAIRNAGGIGRAKLRHTAQDDKKGDRWSSASVGGDLMADLHAKLALRRKGIAGPAASALERMSSRIPPPPKPNETTASDRNSATSEYDSQPDTDDWEE